jgi:hypothetical protein
VGVAAFVVVVAAGEIEFDEGSVVVDPLVVVGVEVAGESWVGFWWRKGGEGDPLGGEL